MHPLYTLDSQGQLPTRTRADLDAVYGGRVPPLAQIAKAATGPYRIMLTGTSIANNSNSAVKTMTEWLTTLHGDSQAVLSSVGGAGGSYTNTINGWTKQYYGGPMLTRLRGDSTATAAYSNDLNGYGDQVVIEWSRETDTGACEVLVDGVSVGSFGSSGAQAYAQRTVFTVARGPHRVQINKPATGVAYIEQVEILDTARTGVEVRDATLGGSSIYDMFNLKTALAGQTPGIPVVGDNGLRAFFDRADVDLHIVHHTVNDTKSLEWAEGGFRTAVNQIVSLTRARNTPVVFVIEMGGNLAATTTNANHLWFTRIREHLLAQRVHNHVTVIDWHGATILEDKAEYARRYYGITNYNPSTGTYTGDFIHPNKSGYRVLENQLAAALPTTQPKRELPAQIATDRLRTTPPGGADRSSRTDGTQRRYTAAAGGTLLATSAGKGSAFQGRVTHYYRDAGATNFAASTAADIAKSTTSDGWGKYLDMSNKNIALGYTVDWPSGDKVILTVRASGTVVFRADGDINLYADGVLIPKTDTVNNRTLLNYVVGSGVEPVTLSVQIGAATAGRTFYLSGRVYEVAMTRSTVPLFTGGTAALDAHEWPASRMIDPFARPSLEDTPAITWSNGSTATALTSPVEYKPKGLGGGTKITGWNGQDDPNFEFWPGSFESANGANSDLSLIGELKPGGATQFATWPVVFAFNANDTDTVELAFYTSPGNLRFLIEVNGRLLQDTVHFPSSEFSNNNWRITLKFPVATTRHIRIWGSGYLGILAVRVPTGKTITKPAISPRLVAVIGDSFANGAGRSNTWPDQGASTLETFAPRMLRMLGYDRMLLAAVGGTGWQTNGTFADRIDFAVTRNPQLLVIYGSINDGSNPTNHQAVVEAALAKAASIPRVIVIPTGVPGYERNDAAVTAAAKAAGREVIEWGLFFTGTGKVDAPAGDGNRDFFRMADGTHPTLDAHRAMARTLYGHLTK